MKKSRIKVKSKLNKEGSIDVKIGCKICGNPITHSNEFGMYCDSECGIDDDKKAKEKIEKIFKGFTNLFK